MTRLNRAKREVAVAFRGDRGSQRPVAPPWDSRTCCGGRPPGCPRFATSRPGPITLPPARVAVTLRGARGSQLRVRGGQPRRGGHGGCPSRRRGSQQHQRPPEGRRRRGGGRSLGRPRIATHSSSPRRSRLGSSGRSLGRPRIATTWNAPPTSAAPPWRSLSGGGRGSQPRHHARPEGGQRRWRSPFGAIKDRNAGIPCVRLLGRGDGRPPGRPRIATSGTGERTPTSRRGCRSPGRPRIATPSPSPAPRWRATRRLPFRGDRGSQLRGLGRGHRPVVVAVALRGDRESQPLHRARRHVGGQRGGCPSGVTEDRNSTCVPISWRAKAVAVALWGIRGSQLLLVEVGHARMNAGGRPPGRPRIATMSL
jgi:hypothetical protein